MKKRSLLKSTGVLLALCAALSITAPAQSLTTLLTFNGSNGSNPEALTIGANGNLYGAANQLGLGLGGSIFEITTAGTLIDQYYFNSFDPSGGEYPNGGLVQTANRNFYGTTSNGGVNTGGNGAGTVFKIAEGKVITLYAFCSKANCADGAYPYAGLVQARNGNFYGTTYQGGTSTNCIAPGSGCGTIFEITPAGELTTLYSFCPEKNCPDGYYPYGALVQGQDGNFYGTAYEGGSQACGAGGCGTVYKITPAGKFTTLYRFCSLPGCADGVGPAAGLVQGSNGDFFGTTGQGGIVNGCPVNFLGCGTVFEITPSGKLRTLYTFCTQENCTDGGAPLAPLMQSANGTFYGTAAFGGATGYGDVFEITAAGQFSTLYSFCSLQSCADGATPEAGLVEANGLLYGTTSGDYGTEGSGTVFSLPLD